MFGSLGVTELILILVIVLIIFGAGKLPQLGEGLGKAIKGFKKSVHEADQIEAEAQAAAQQQAAAPAITTPPAQAPAVVLGRRLCNRVVKRVGLRWRWHRASRRLRRWSNRPPCNRSRPRGPKRVVLAGSAASWIPNCN